jgi:hypothetical protein
VTVEVPSALGVMLKRWTLESPSNQCEKANVSPLLVSTL